MQVIRHENEFESFGSSAIDCWLAKFHATNVATVAPPVLFRKLLRVIEDPEPEDEFSPSNA